MVDGINSVIKSKEVTQTIGDLILLELETVELAIKEEKERFEKEKMSEKEKGKRLLYLFQKDLMPGINGMILESKDKRDNVKLKGSSRTAKALSWLFLGSVNVGMLFYILLFALSQDSHRQGAWGQSFALWLIVEVFLVSSLSVLIMHVWIPSIVMRDLGIIKKKLIGNVITFYQNMAKGMEESSMNKVFNSAEYLFVSHRLSVDYSDLKIAKMILSFQTPWPKQSYQHVQDVSKKYDRKFAALSRSFSMVVLFFLSSLLSVPISVQDMIIQMVSTTAMGYTLLLHLQLYQIFPILVLIPTLFIAGLVHFLIQSNKAKQKIEQMKLLKEVTGTNVAHIPKIDSGEDKLDRKSPDGLRHKNRRESIQQGIKLAKKLDQLIYTNRQDSKISINSDGDYDLSSIASHLESFEPSLEEMKGNDGSKDNSLFSSASNDSATVLRDHRAAFADLTKTFKAAMIAPAHVESYDMDSFQDNFDDNENDDDLFNLHLAIDPHDSSSTNDSQDFADDARLELNQTWQVVSLSNSSIASRFLGLIDTRRRSYEKHDAVAAQASLIKMQSWRGEGEDLKENENEEDVSSIVLHEAQERRDDLSSLTHTNFDLPPLNTSSKKHRKIAITCTDSSSNSFDEVSSIHLPVSEVSASSYASSVLMTGLFSQGGSRKRRSANSLPSLNEQAELNEDEEEKQRKDSFSDSYSEQSSYIHLPANADDDDEEEEDDDDDDMMNLHLAK